MKTIVLTDKEEAALARVLELYLRDLGGEIADTDNWQFKDQLRGERTLLEAIAARLQKVSKERKS